MTVFYLGSHDASGRAIETDLGDRIRSYGAKLTIKRLAIHASDIAKFKLPPLRVKESDSRAAGFLRRYDKRVKLMHRCRRSYGGALRNRNGEAGPRAVGQSGEGGKSGTGEHSGNHGTLADVRGEAMTD